MEASSNRRLALLWLVASFGAVAVARYEGMANPTRPAAVVEATAPLPHSQGDALRDDKLVDINAASAGELELLPGVGPSLAKRLVEAREKAGSFDRPSDLLRVKGVGQKTLAKLTPWLKFGSEQLEHTTDSKLPFGVPRDLTALQETTGAHVDPDRPTAVPQVVDAKQHVPLRPHAEARRAPVAP